MMIFHSYVSLPEGIIPSDDQVWNEAQAEIEQTAGRLEWLDPLPREVRQTRRWWNGESIGRPEAMEAAGK